MGKKSIANQLVSAVCKSFCPGADKRAIKMDGKLEHQIPGLQHYQSLKSFAKSFGDWVKSEYPEIRQVRDLDVSVCNKFLDMKADICAAKTLSKYRSYIGKLQMCVNHFFHSANVDWKSEIVVPESRKTVKSVRFGVRMDRRDFDKIVAHAAERFPHAANAARITALIGCRVEGCSSITAGMVRFDEPGRYGHGEVHLYKTNDDGKTKGIEKGGRPRVIDIRTAEDAAFIKGLCQGKSPADRLVPIGEDGINKGLRKTMEELGIKDKYPLKSIHAIRSMFAQELWDYNKAAGVSYEESLRVINNQLGHGDKRGLEGVKAYINTDEPY